MRATDTVEPAQSPDLARSLNSVIGSRGLLETLHAVVNGVVEAVGFDVAAVNYRHVDGTFEVLAVAGSDAARSQLLGQRLPADAFDAEFALADGWGTLRYVPHERLPDGHGDGWIPDLSPLDAPDAWHPDDALFAPLTSQTGELLGVLSVDLPTDRRRPGKRQQEALSVFAALAGTAIHNARLTESLQEREEAFRLVFEGAGNGMALLGVGENDFGRFLRVNAAACALLGRSEADLLELRFEDITHPDDRQRDVLAARRELSTGSGVLRREKRLVDSAGRTIWAAVTASTVRQASTGTDYAVAQIEDVSDRRAAQEELTHRAGHDDLTGLPNRRAAYAALTTALRTAHRGARNGALLFCDLDGFKHVNDTYGHLAGDRALIVIAQRLAGACRRPDTVARLGGDEFLVVAAGATLQEARQLARRLQHAASEPLVIDGVLVQLTMSVGIAEIVDDQDPCELVRRADAEMYRMKRSGRDLPT